MKNLFKKPVFWIVSLLIIIFIILVVQSNVYQQKYIEIKQ